ncbi:DUF4883 family protein [Clostridium sp. Sa3CUN1]|uniref:DUF4883 family protein n=1 Tax=Clostridium gallinarum TaxID=2762246 RepID=A0ABR8Q461_9CLOT|nr:DUF4883 family protein [Clostridium gallinarum]MBD7915216.1 DUF4883 family protein [Clostridium gallinarum]
MKKYITVFLAILISLLLTSCNFNKSQYISPKNKPKINYYTSEIENHIKNEESYTIKIFDLNVYKYYEVSKKEHSIIPEFIDNIDNDNYDIEIDENLSPEYEIIIEFEKEKYIINAYNDKLISIHPWDGIYPQDTISMEGIPDYYNIYKYCEYIKKVSRGFEG